MHNRADQQRRHYSTFTHPVNAGHENKRQSTRYTQQRNVKAQFHIAEIAPESAGNSLHEILSRHHAAFALTSKAIPNARMVQPISKSTTCETYDAGVSQESIIIEKSMNSPKQNETGI